MAKHSTLIRSTLGAALLSTLLLSTSAHAGLLGAGGAAGGIGGGLNGGLTPRSLGFDGRASGQASRDGALLPRRDAVTDRAGDAVQAGKDTGQSGAARAAETRSMAADSASDKAGRVRALAGTAGGSASGGFAADASVSRTPTNDSIQADGLSQAGGSLSRQVPGAPATPTAAAAALPTPDNAAPTSNRAGAGGGMAAATRRAEASAGGSGQVSRSDRSVNADAAAQGSVQR